MMFERVFSVPYYGLGVNDRVKAGLILQFFQETAASHADAVGIGVADLLKRGITWVLRRYRVKVHSYPGMGDLTVRTWFEPRRNLVSVRVFEILDSAGCLVADAWSGWIVVDLKRGRPVRLDRALPDEYFARAEPTGDDVDDEMKPVAEDFDLERGFRVRRQELDLNGHTNHTVYFEWAMESVPDCDVEGAEPVEFDAEYRVPVKREEVIVRTRRTSESPLRYAHSVFIKGSGVEAARLSTVWAKPGIDRTASVQ